MDDPGNMKHRFIRDLWLSTLSGGKEKSTTLLDVWIQRTSGGLDIVWLNI